MVIGPLVKAMEAVASESSTQPCTPNVQAEAEEAAMVQQSEIFAWLRPSNQVARDAFDAVVSGIRETPEEFKHAERFLYFTSTRAARAESVFTEDGEATIELEPIPTTLQWEGAYKFSLKTPPQKPGAGWHLGSGRGYPEIDVLLALPTAHRANSRVAGCHAIISFHSVSARILLQARHTIITGRDGTNVLRQSNSRVIEHGELIAIGDCLYTFELTDLFASSEFDKSLSLFMKKYSAPEWTLHNLLSPSTVGQPTSIGKYYCSPNAFAQGTFGKVTVGWSKEGTAVAIKHFKQPNKDEFEMHQYLMGKIGSHDNILQLLDSVGHFDAKIPDALCVYFPLAALTLAEVIASYQADIAAQLTLLRDFLNGLSYLHDNKKLMHRDIKPENLAVCSFTNPKGVIIDLDSLTQSEESTDHRRGTLCYLAPEVVRLKNWEKDGKQGCQPPAYTQSVDVWGLGISMASLSLGYPWHWAYFSKDKPAGSETLIVTNALHSEFKSRFEARMNRCSNPLDRAFLQWIIDMTEYRSSDRVSASELLARVSPVTEEVGKGAIALKKLSKRPLEENK